MTLTRTLAATIFMVLLGLASGCSNSDPVSPPVVVPPRDSVLISTDTVASGDTAVVTLTLVNPDSTVASLNLWLRSDGAGVVYDTVELISPRFPPTGMELVAQRNDSLNLLSLLFFDWQFVVDIPPGRGPLMRIRYTVDTSQAAGDYTLDTSSVLNALPGVTLGSPVGITYRSGRSVPRVGFGAGAVVVQ